MQVPGGTIRDGEAPAAAASREIAEETGLGGATLGALRGEAAYRWRLPDRHRLDRRFFFHATIAGAAPESWRHFEMEAENGSAPIAFDFSWWDLGEGMPTLTHGQGDLLPRLRARLGF